VLVERAYLLRFEHGKESLDARQFNYPESRFRYLRIRVYPDPEVDKEPVELGDATVFRSVDVPGETLAVPLEVGGREAVMGDGGPGSAWILQLPARNVPCEKLLVSVAEAEFARNYRVELVRPAATTRPFVPIGGGEWSRRAGEPLAPLEARFIEQPASRFRL